MTDDTINPSAEGAADQGRAEFSAEDSSGVREKPARPAPSPTLAEWLYRAGWRATQEMIAERDGR